MKNVNPKISIIMTIYNHEKFLKKSIQSIINQSFRNWELVAVDNGSNDNSRKILNSINDKRVKKFYLKKNIGRTNCLNFSLKKCKGKLVAINDSDDISDKDRLKNQFNYFKKNNNCQFLASNYILNDKKRKIKIRTDTFNLIKNRRKILFENYIALSSVMYTKKIIKKLGGYPKNYRYSQDYMFYLKIYLINEIHIINKYLVAINFNHENTETNRLLYKNFTIFYENMKRLRWIKQNFFLSSLEKLKINYKIFLNYLKVMKIKIGFNS